MISGVQFVGVESGGNLFLFADGLKSFEMCRAVLRSFDHNLNARNRDGKYF